MPILPVKELYTNYFEHLNMMYELREDFTFAYNGDFRSLLAQLTVFRSYFKSSTRIIHITQFSHVILLKYTKNRVSW